MEDKNIRVYRAKKIITMDRNRPFATHLAVQGDRILAVGDLDQVSAWGKYELVTFDDLVLMPGFVEGHSHAIAGGIWRYLYLGFHDRLDPKGKLWKGLMKISDVITRLNTADQKLKEHEPLICWGFDPIFLRSERLHKKHLDAVNAKRPIVVIHSNFHLMTVNSATLEMVGYDQDTDIEGY